MDDGNLAILVDAKTEYTKQLVNIISPNIFIGIKTIYNKCKETCEKYDVLYQFQQDLSEIPKWNQEVINEQYSMLIESSNCDWLEDLITAVFVSHTRILTSININKNKNKINLKIPKVDHFIHLCYIEVARNFWKNPYLFDENISKFEYQRNRRDAEIIIEKTINETIRKQLPVKHILKEYLGNDFKESNIESLNDESINEHENLRKMVKAEIENCSKEKLQKLNITSDYQNNLSDTPTELKLEISQNIDEQSSNKPVEKVEAVEAAETSKPIEVKVETVEPLEVKAVETSKPLEVKAVETVEPLEVKAVETSKPLEVKVETVEPLEVKVETVEIPKTLEVNVSKHLSDEEIDVNNVIDNEINNLKIDSLDNIDNGLNIESLNLNLDDDLSNLEEIYIDKTNNESIEPLNLNENSENKIKTVYIETNEKPKKKSSFNETDIEINYSESEDDNYKNRKYSKNDFSFFK